jgi:hypothetical protein
MLSGMKDEAVVQMNPRVPDGLAAFEHDMTDPGPRELSRRSQAGRAGANDDRLVKFDGCASDGYNVLRYSINARRFSSVRIRVHMSCPWFPHPSRAVLNQFRSLPNLRSSCKSPFAPSSGSE